MKDGAKGSAPAVISGVKTCRRCGEPGHLARNCTKRSTGAEVKPKKRCYKCGKLGHRYRDCTNVLPASAPPVNASNTEPAPVAPALTADAVHTNELVTTDSDISRAPAVAYAAEEIIAVYCVDDDTWYKAIIRRCSMGAIRDREGIIYRYCIAYYSSASYLTKNFDQVHVNKIKSMAQLGLKGLPEPPASQDERKKLEQDVVTIAKTRKIVLAKMKHRGGKDRFYPARVVEKISDNVECMFKVDFRIHRGHSEVVKHTDLRIMYEDSPLMLTDNNLPHWMDKDAVPPPPRYQDHASPRDLPQLHPPFTSDRSDVLQIGFRKNEDTEETELCTKTAWRDFAEVKKIAAGTPKNPVVCAQQQYGDGNIYANGVLNASGSDDTFVKWTGRNGAAELTMRTADIGKRVVLSATYFC